LSISIGILLLLSVIFTKTKLFNAQHLGFIYSFISSVKIQLGNLFNKKGLHFLFLIGVLNGLLPCGLVYLGIAGAIATGHFLKGAEFMLYFGFGTIPIMYAVAFFGQFISLTYRNTIRKSMPIVVTVMGITLIIRGMNLGIPYVSPAFEKESHEVACCEKPNNGKIEIQCVPKKCNKK
jgi:sulfite exporter TauE/SafE